MTQLEEIGVRLDRIATLLEPLAKACEAYLRDIEHMKEFSATAAPDPQQPRLAHFRCPKCGSTKWGGTVTTGFCCSPECDFHWDRATEDEKILYGG